MRWAGGILQRHGLSLLFTAALVYVFVTATVPALRERRELRQRRARTEIQLSEYGRAVEQRELWIRGVQEDPYLKERLLDVHERSPALPGARTIRTSTTEDSAEEP